MCSDGAIAARSHRTVCSPASNMKTPRRVCTSYSVWNRGTRAVEEVPVYNAARLNFYHAHPLGRLLMNNLFSTRLYNRFWLRRMYRPASRKLIPAFIEKYRVNTDEILDPLDSFQTFNDFFIRKLKPTARPVDAEPSAVVAPSDGQMTVQPELTPGDTFLVKGHTFSLETLLGDKGLAAQFKQGALANIYLAPYDYHRFHYPVDGVLEERRRTGGRLFAVNPEISIANGFRPYDVNVRQINVLSDARYGRMLIVEVGAHSVGRIVDSDGPNGSKRKGEEKGYFEYGGSTVVLVFQRGAIRFDDDLCQKSQEPIACRVKMGERIGQLR
jgi:phosphatidylserine decarboxylase